MLEAVKWIGNSGSHSGAMPLEDVLEGVALLERALHIVYDDTADQLDQLAGESTNASAVRVGRGRRHRQPMVDRSSCSTRERGVVKPIPRVISSPGSPRQLVPLAEQASLCRSLTTVTDRES